MPPANERYQATESKLDKLYKITQTVVVITVPLLLSILGWFLVDTYTELRASQKAQGAELRNVVVQIQGVYIQLTERMTTATREFDRALISMTERVARLESMTATTREQLSSTLTASVALQENITLLWKELATCARTKDMPAPLFKEKVDRIESELGKLAEILRQHMTTPGKH